MSACYKIFIHGVDVGICRHVHVLPPGLHGAFARHILARLPIYKPITDKCTSPQNAACEVRTIGHAHAEPEAPNAIQGFVVIGGHTLRKDITGAQMNVRNALSALLRECATSLTTKVSTAYSPAMSCCLLGASVPSLHASTGSCCCLVSFSDTFPRPKADYCNTSARVMSSHVESCPSCVHTCSVN